MFVLENFQGSISEKEIFLPYNFSRNLTKYIIDSNGKVWTLNHKKHTHNGIKRFVSHLVNISSDIYSYDTSSIKNVAWLKGVLNEYKKKSDPLARDLAKIMLKDLAGVDGNDTLSSIMSKLNL